MEELLSGPLLAWLEQHRHWTGAVIFAIAMLESVAIAGLLVPGVVLLFAAAALAGSQQMGLIEILAFAFAGAVCGDLLSFALGRWLHQDIRRIWPLRRYPEWVDRGEVFFRRHGMLSILIGRFVGPVRPVIPLVAGMFDMPFWRFLLVNLFSALLWAPVYILPGYATGSALHWPVPEHFWNAAGVLLIELLAIGIGCFWLLARRQRWSPLASAALLLASAGALQFTLPLQQVLDHTLANWLNGMQPWPVPAAMGTLWLLAGLLPTLGRSPRPALLMLLAALLSSATLWLAAHDTSTLLLGSILAWLLAALVNATRDLQLHWQALALFWLVPAAAVWVKLLALPADFPLRALLLPLLHAAAGCALASWLLQRSAPLPPLNAYRRFGLLLIPLVPLASLLLPR